MMYSLWYVPVGLVLLYYVVFFFLQSKEEQYKSATKRDTLEDFEIDENDEIEEDFEYKPVLRKPQQNEEERINMRVIKDHTN